MKNLGQNLKKEIEKSEVISFLLVFFTGLITYYQMPSAWLTNPDGVWNSIYFRLGHGGEKKNGRLFQIVVDKLRMNMVTPVLTTVVCILLLALTACIVCRIFESKNVIVNVLIGMILIFVPCTSSSLTYYYCSDSFMLALFCVVLGVYLIRKYPSIKSSIAAIILFGKNPRYYMPGAYVQYVRFVGKEKGGEVLNEKRFQGPLYSMLPTLESFVSDAIITQRPVSASLFREKMIINYPNNALRELMMNACMHRDYQSNMPIRLYQFDDHIEIMNAGGLYGEARPENFPMVNDYRNPIVAEAMKEMKYVNMFNQGVKRVQDMLRENGNKEAEFNVSKLTVFSVDVFSNEDSITQTTTQTLSEVQISIIDYIHNHPNASRKEIAANISNITENGVKYHMQKLQKQGIIKRVGADFGGHWEITISK